MENSEKKLNEFKSKFIKTVDKYYPPAVAAIFELMWDFNGKWEEDKFGINFNNLSISFNLKDSNPKDLSKDMILINFHNIIYPLTNSLFTQTMFYSAESVEEPEGFVN